LYPASRHHRMSGEVLERVISSYLATEQPEYLFGWQGGEPTLMGPDFFRKAAALEEKYGTAGAIVSNGLQTNGTLIDDELARLFAKYHFLVGVSLDGPEEIHNRYRLTPGGRGSHKDVLRGIECLKRNGVEFNVLTLVHSANVNRGREVYRYLRDMGFRYHQYIPCVEFDKKNKPLPFTITGEEWGRFLCEVFDEWIEADRYRVSIRLLDSILAVLIGMRPTICHMSRNCCQYFVVEHNGDIYPCDFFVERATRLGNIMENSWEELADSADYLAFGRQKGEWPAECAGCEYLAYCAGDCVRNRIYEGSDGRKLSWLCEGWKEFFRHSLPALKSLAFSIGKERQGRHFYGREKSFPRPSWKKIGRNDPCPCGSGKKYKRCCGKR